MKTRKTKDLEGKNVEFDVADWIIARLTRNAAGTSTTAALLMSHVGPLRRRLMVPIPTRGHIMTFIGAQRKMLLIWQLIHTSSQFIDAI
jgi:hypothetical protein